MAASSALSDFNSPLSSFSARRCRTSTTLEVLLNHLQVDTLILTGIAADICVLFTANDAYMRGFELIVPSDCVASNGADVNRRALSQMSTRLKADTRPSPRLRLRAQIAIDRPDGS